MKVIRAAALVLLALAGTAGTAPQATGQVATGSSETALGNVRAFRDLSRFGRCYVNNYRDTALSLIATTPGTPEEDRVFRRMIRGNQLCLHPGTNVTVSVIYFRGVVAEGLLHADTPLPASYRLPAPTVSAVRSLADVALCYVNGHQVQVQGLLATEAGSPEEVAAVQSLWNDFRTCLPPEARIRLNAPWIRFLLAEALLRFDPAAAAPASAS